MERSYWLRLFLHFFSVRMCVLCSLLLVASYDGLMPPLAACHCSNWCVLFLSSYLPYSVAEWLACWVQVAANRVHQAAKLVAALSRVSGVTAGLAESNGSLPPGLWLTSPAGWLSRTGISSGTLRSVIECGLPLPFLLGKQTHSLCLHTHVARVVGEREVAHQSGALRRVVLRGDVDQHVFEAVLVPRLAVASHRVHLRCMHPPPHADTLPLLSTCSTLRSVHPSVCHKSEFY